MVTYCNGSSGGGKVFYSVITRPLLDESNFISPDNSGRRVFRQRIARKKQGSAGLLKVTGGFVLDPVA